MIRDFCGSGKYECALKGEHEPQKSLYDLSMTVEDILADFPQLTRRDILACLACAADMGRGIGEVESGIG
ncbi:MAG TPA: DUF433 domain-containing protein [Niabella sp.]|nr:DUF433 domain-containing protein [Niabella sp.]